MLGSVLLSAAVAARTAACPAGAVEISTGACMPQMSLGTWKAANDKPSDPTVGLPPWLAAGGKGVDCALNYFNQAEIAPLIKGHSDLFVTTKVCGPGAGGAPLCLTAAQALGQVKKDVAQLGVGQVDLVLLHVPIGPIATLWKGLEEAMDQNLTRAIGISNFGPAEITKLLKTARIKPAVNQCSMGVKNHNDAAIKTCQDNGIMYEAWGTMKNCEFTNPTITGIAAAHNKTAAQVCLRYVLDRGCTLAVGTGTDPVKAKAYAAENPDTLTFKLTEAEVAQLSAL